MIGSDVFHFQNERETQILSLICHLSGHGTQLKTDVMHPVPHVHHLHLVIIVPSHRWLLSFESVCVFAVQLLCSDNPIIWEALIV